MAEKAKARSNGMTGGGVDKVKGDCNSVRLEVTGKVDPFKVKEMVERETKKKVKLILPSAETECDRDDGGEKKDAKADGEAGGGEKKDEETADKGGEKKEKEAPAVGGGSGDAPKMEVSKMEYFGYPYPPPPTYWHDAPLYSRQSYLMEPQHHQIVYMNQGYAMDHHNPRLHAPQMFSDENPNACSIM